MIESTTFPSKIKYQDDSFSMANSSFVNKTTIKSRVMNVEDLEHISEEDLDAIFSFMDKDETKNLSGRIIKVDKSEGYLLLDISGNA